MQSFVAQPTSGTDQSAWDSKTVAEFTEGPADILVLRRNAPSDFAEEVQAARVHEYLAPITREKAGFEIRAGLGELRLKSAALEEDLTKLVNAFLDQFELEKARLRIEITQTQSCPKFHSDHVNVRLVTTYLGQTTEYQFSGESSAYVAPLGGLVFLKGKNHPTHSDSVHHRSPEVPIGQKRLCVAIDY